MQLVQMLSQDFARGGLRVSLRRNLLHTNRPQQRIQQPVSVEKETGRNEKVTITNGSETKELKWKKAKPLVDSGEWRKV